MLSGRRALLQRLAVLAGAACGAPGLGASPSGGRTGPWVWAWTGTQLWLASPGGLAGPWPQAADGLPPAPAAGGLWQADPQRPSLQWRPVDTRPATAGLGDITWQAPLPAPAQHLAAAADGHWVAAATADGLHLLDRRSPDPLHHLPRNLHGQPLGPVRRLAALPGRRSLLVDWTEGGEWWELSLDPHAAPVYDGLVHDWRLGEGLPRPGNRHPRRLPLAAPPASPPVLLATWPHQPFALARQGAQLLVVHLDVRRPVWHGPADGGGPVPATVAAALLDDRLWLASGHHLLQVDTRRWQTVHDASATPPPGPVQQIWPGPLLLIGGRWWQPSPGAGWALADKLPPGVAPERTAQADTGTWAGSTACIGQQAGAAMPGHAPGGLLWCRSPGQPAWTLPLPAAPQAWRGLAFQPDDPVAGAAAAVQPE